jgi:hypothetical protein
MKKIFLLLTVFLMVFASCEPLEEINTALDAIDTSIIGEATYTLTDEDYDDLDLNRGSFSSVDDVKTKVPALLSDTYPAWGKGSSVNVNFNLYVGRAFEVKNYSLVQADYTSAGSDLLGFNSDDVPADLLPAIILNKYGADDVEDGDYAGIQYYQFTPGTYTVTPLVSMDDNLDFGTVGGDLTSVSNDNWTSHSGAGNGPITYEGDTNLVMSNYPSSDMGGSFTFGSGSEDVNSVFSTISTKTVYASALINLSEVSNGNYFFHMMEAPDTQPYAQFRARVGAKDDGNGKILFGIGASSSSLTYGETAYDLNTTYLIVSSYNIETGVSNLYILDNAASEEPTTPEATNTGDSGNAISAIAVRQSGGIPIGRIDGIRVANTWSAIMSNDNLDDEVIGNKESYNQNYAYADGAWAPAEGDAFYAVTEEDFAGMGINNFGSSTQPDDYMLTFLNTKFLYAQVDTQMDVVYKYVSSSSGPQTRGNQFTKTGANTWEAYQTTIESNLQFGHDGTTWEPDNTIRYTLSRGGTDSDYDWIASQLTTVEYAGLIGNLANYDDFDYNWTSAQIQNAMILFAGHHAPNAEEGQKYIFTYVIYDNGENEYQINLIKTGGVWVLNN